MAVHPTAIVDPGARIAPTAEIGPYSIVGAEVEIGSGTRLMAHVYVEGPTWIGDDKHPPTVVTWTLTAVPEGTLLRLEHTGFRGLRGLIDTWMLGSGWKKMLSKKFPAALARLE